MLSSDVALCNLALSHLGISTVIQSMTERSKEAQACTAFYQQTLEEVLRDFPWPFATVTGALALVAANPTTEWAFSYRVPSDALNLRRILSPCGRVETLRSRVPFRLGSDAQGLLIFTDQEDAVGEWTSRESLLAVRPPDFVQAHALLLAGYLAPRVTKGDDAKLGDRALKLYAWRLDTAWENAARESVADLPPESEFISCRD